MHRVPMVAARLPTYSKTRRNGFCYGENIAYSLCRYSFFCMNLIKSSSVMGLEK